MSRLLNFNFEEGTKIYFELYNGEQYEGTFIESDTFRIKVSNLCQLPNKHSIPGFTHFFKKELLVFKPIENEKNSAADKDSKNRTVNSRNENLKYWEELNKKWSYISILNEDFDDCINKLKSCSTIAINVIRCKSDSDINLLAIATKFDIYVINIKTCSCKVFDNGLREIFHLKKICKVVFNSCQITNFLSTYNVRLINFFDLQIADKFTKKDKESLRYLSDLLIDYLEFDSKDAKLLDNLTTTLVNTDITKSVLKTCVKTVAYLIPLKFLLESIMLKDFYKKNDHYLNRTRDKSPVSSLVTSEQVFHEFENMNI